MTCPKAAIKPLTRLGFQAAQEGSHRLEMERVPIFFACLEQSVSKVWAFLQAKYLLGHASSCPNQITALVIGLSQMQNKIHLSWRRALGSDWASTWRFSFAQDSHAADI